MDLKKTLQGMYLSTEKIDFSQVSGPVPVGTYTQADINFSQSVLIDSAFGVAPDFYAEMEVRVQEQLIIAECMHTSLGDEMTYSWEELKPRVELRLRRMYGVAM
jgi:hypothetical protein